MKKRRAAAVISVLLVAALSLLMIPTFAKYIVKKGEQSEITSQNFYFSSNFLKSGEVPTYEIYGDSVTFTVRNYIDSLRINGTAIDFTVTADSGTVRISNGSLTGAVSSSKNITFGSLTGAVSSSKNITLSYDFAADEPQKEITVWATGTGEFTQTLSAKFIFIQYDGLRYEIKDQPNRDYAELYIYTGNTAGNVTMNWNIANLVIDETNDYIFGNTTLNAAKNSVTVTDIPADTTVKIVFFKKIIAQDYTRGMTKTDGNITIALNNA